jgi:hypothetical protein
VFVFDLDAFVLSRVHPLAIAVTEYRFFVFFGFLLLWWFLVGTRSLITDLAYVILYPLILICWHLPRRYLRNWTRAFALLFAVVSTFKAMRTRMAFLFMALAAVTTILISRRAVLLVPSMAILVIYLGYHLVRQFRMAFGPSTLLRGITDLLGRQWQTWGDRLMKSNTTELEKFPRESEDFRKKRFEQLQLLFLLNRLVLLIASRLRKIQEMRLLLLYSTATVVYLFLLAVTVFGFEYYGLFNLDEGSFRGEGGSRIWFFLWFSLNTILPGNVGNFFAYGTGVRVLTSLEQMSGLLILVIFGSILVAIIKERNDEDIGTLIAALTAEADAVGKAILERYGLSLQDAEAEVRSLAPGLGGFLDYSDRG